MTWRRIAWRRNASWSWGRASSASAAAATLGSTVIYPPTPHCRGQAIARRRPGGDRGNLPRLGRRGARSLRHIYRARRGRCAPSFTASSPASRPPYYSLRYAADGAIRGSGDTAIDTSTSSNGPQVLVIEDDPTARELLQALLEDAGYAVDCASSGPAGLSRILDGGIDLVLL